MVNCNVIFTIEMFTLSNLLKCRNFELNYYYTINKAILPFKNKLQNIHYKQLLFYGISRTINFTTKLEWMTSS